MIIRNFLRQTDKNFSQFLLATIVFYFYKTAFWPLTILFVIGYAIVLILFINKFDWKFGLSGFFRDFMHPIILAVIFILIFLLNGHFSNTIAIKDVIRILVLFSLFYFLYWNRTVDENELPKTFIINLIIITTAVISVLNILNQLNISIFPTRLLLKLNISEGSAIANDYNFFSLFILFGLVILNYKSINNKLTSYFPKWITYALNSIFIINIVLSSSRRGIIILILITLIYFVFKKSLKFSYKKLFIKAIIVFLLIIFGMIVFQKIPKQKISIIVYRYATLAGITDFNSIERFLWEREHNVPKNKNYLIDNSSFNPNSNYWSKNPSDGTTVSNIETPYGAGIKLFRNGPNIDFSLFYTGPKILYYSDHTYKISFKIKFISGDFNSFNVGWWVDDGGKGYENTLYLEKEIEPIGEGWYSCTSQYTFIDNHVGLVGFINSVKDQTSFIISDFELIDLDYNSILPRFEFESHGPESLNTLLDSLKEINLINNGDFSDGLSFWKHYSDSLTIKITEIDKKKCALFTRGDGDGGSWSLYYDSKNIEFKANNEYQIAFKIKLIFPNEIPFNVGFWVDEGEGYQAKLDLKIDTLEDEWLHVSANYRFKNDQSNLIFPINSQSDNSQFYITDISLINLTQPQYKKKPHFQERDQAKKSALISDRTSKLKYSIELWKIKYKWYNKLFGHGFDYYEWFGEKFYNDPVRGDYPHNPFISVILYSGIVGLILFLWLLFRVISIYIKFRKEYAVLLVCFLITFFFSFFSGSSPFDPPIMGFFMLLPFFLEYVNKDKIPLNGSDN